MAERDAKGRFIKGNTEGHRFKKGEVTNPHGRPPLIMNVLEDMPKDAQLKIYNVLWAAIKTRDVKEATEILNKGAEELPECGFALQICIRALMGKQGFLALMDICDRLFGKPRQSTDHNINADGFQLNINVAGGSTPAVLKDIAEGKAQR